MWSTVLAWVVQRGPRIWQVCWSRSRMLRRTVAHGPRYAGWRSWLPIGLVVLEEGEDGPDGNVVHVTHVTGGGGFRFFFF